jgi:hypothetical protein
VARAALPLSGALKLWWSSWKAPYLFTESTISLDLPIVGSCIVRFWLARQHKRQDLAFAFIYKARGMPLAAGVLHPFAGQLFPSMGAALAMSFSSVAIIATSA